MLKPDGASTQEREDRDGYRSNAYKQSSKQQLAVDFLCIVFYHLRFYSCLAGMIPSLWHLMSISDLE